MSEHLQNMRRHYQRDGLLEAHVPDEPFALLHAWLQQAIECEQAPVEANAMYLASVDAQGLPHCRVVLLKDLAADGLVFYSHYRSAKGCDFAANPQAAATFHWPGLERQVRVEGVVERVTAAESDRYYQSRPLLSRLACWASEQSQPLGSRAELEARLQQIQQQYADNPPERPEDWGGYRLLALRVEFWQGRPGRLHDRINYLKKESGWRRERLAP
ncbi:pyridoxamine 5'-phosphate oxidase [Pseudomonas cavernicola]|uniref:Pyridoxine/pyridoxamine 5'-phosphate oxidase n=1 Tax=Pseudomonas cavernicola TaxID=2320866 RepID=A0A418X8T1_9PSED|nr:pyridoxamine 5'-phosphate oxidase [Pseudomonas cavernicola]RJG08892.1 pyridoxamine 5'-phosphate oxidase [Pseudomonas cavernicola]